MEESKNIISFATRSSQLAMTQTLHVIELFKSANSDREITVKINEIHHSLGDKDLTNPLHQIGGIGLFTKQVEQELLNKTSQVAIHSLKDLPTVIVEDLYIAAIPDREQKEDVVIIRSDLVQKGLKSLNDLPSGSLVGSSSLRRISMLKIKHPLLKVIDLRGNLNTRLAKLEEGKYDAIILARAGVLRLGWEEKITQVLDKNIYLYAPGQGALGVQCRKDDDISRGCLDRFDNKLARKIVEAERAFLRQLEGGCTLPIAVNSQIFTENGEEIKDQNNQEYLKQNLKFKLTGAVYNRNMTEEWLSDIEKNMSNLMIMKSIEGDLQMSEDLGIQLAEMMKADGAKEFIDKQEST